MNKITMLVRAAEAAAIRKALFTAGAHRVAIVPLHSEEWNLALADWYIGKPLMWQDAPLRFDVHVEPNNTDAIISAFLQSAHVGKIENISCRSLKDSELAPMLLQAA